MIKFNTILEEVATLLKSNSVFGDLLSQDNTALLLTNSLVRTLEKDEVLCRQDMTSQSIYLIVSGELEVSVLSGENIVSLAKRHKGELIGEISALFVMPHIATVTAVQPSIVLEIPTEIFIGIMTNNDELQRAIISRCKDRIIETALRHVPIFRELNQSEFSELCSVASMTTASKGDILIKEGANEHSMYVICKGIVRIFTSINDVDVTVALRRAGEYFGEYSYLTGQPRTASVSALTDLQVVKLKGEAFQSFMDYNESTEAAIKRTSIQRKASLDKLRDNADDKSIMVTRLSRIQEMLKLTE